MIEKCVQLMIEGFSKDPGLLYQMKDVSNSDELFRVMCKGEIETFQQLGFLTTYGDVDGMIISYTMSDLQRPETVAAMQECGKNLMEQADVISLKQLNERAMEVASISKPDWFVPFTGQEEVRIIQVAAIKKEVRGTGLLTKMLESFFRESEEKGMKLALQTHNPENLEKYYHYGFELKEKVSTKDGTLTCYNLLR